ncbi:hypothetical protein BDN72DRAFT_906798 [Pluteus cervinus]|uniref:Uncharacterized protein n=1 Tax=Pluteus cervinus TaxID=181527 RepID=A0ACD2ZYF9_9AGAR|nr:hypothetical protein BDN72DRAFT_906798 [Pluteus cervinus]
MNGEPKPSEITALDPEIYEETYDRFFGDLQESSAKSPGEYESLMTDIFNSVDIVHKESIKSRKGKKRSTAADESYTNDDGDDIPTKIESVDSDSDATDSSDIDGHLPVDETPRAKTPKKDKPTAAAAEHNTAAAKTAKKDNTNAGKNAKKDNNTDAGKNAKDKTDASKPSKKDKTGSKKKGKKGAEDDEDKPKGKQPLSRATSSALSLDNMELGY